MNYTPLYPSHLAANGKIVDFGGWALPVNYGSQIKEHEAVRTDVGMFDVSHMVISDIHGVEAKVFLRYLLSNDVDKLEKFGVGKALYSALLNQEAGVVDDLIVYLMPFGYRVITNSATEVQALSWIKQIAADFKVEIFYRRDLAMIAVQGPQAIAKVSAAHPHVADKLSTLAKFMSVEENNYFYARTGYTGEDGLEIMLPKEDANLFWTTLLDHGVVPCGLGARDTLRLEAGMNLYGHEMDDTITPISCNMDWVVDLTDDSRDFMGKKAYQMARLNPDVMQLTGAVLLGNGVLRAGQKIMCNGLECGVVTSGTFSPTLKKSIAMIRIHSGLSGEFSVDIRGKLELIDLVSLPFVRNGKILISIK